MIHVRARKRLGEFFLDAEIQDEGFICLRGQNGTGKSTFLNVIAGVLKEDEGFVKIGSTDITRKSVDKREVVLITPQSYIPHLTVEKHLIWGMGLKSQNVSGDQVERVKAALGICYSGNLSKLSLGMRERVSLATAVLSNPRLILIDETFSNIDNKAEFISKFKRLCQERRVDSIFTTQTPEDSAFGDHDYVMENGKSRKIF
jgi:molybdate/tungstate transport system ATP-binding protein